MAGAAATGLAAGTPVAAGAGDQGAGAVGMGILAPGSVSATIGTSGVVFAATDAPTKDRLGRLHTFCHAAPGRMACDGRDERGGAVACGTSAIRLRRVISYDELTAQAAEVPAGSDGLLWAPYLFGERTPHLDAEARAAFVGITASHTRAHFVRAVLEGVAFSLRDTFTLFARAGDSGEGDPAGRRRGAGAAVAADSGGCLWAAGGAAGGRGGRGVWGGAAGGYRRGGVGECGGGLCGDGAGGGDDRAASMRM